MSMRSVTIVTVSAEKDPTLGSVSLKINVFHVLGVDASAIRRGIEANGVCFTLVAAYSERTAAYQQTETTRKE
ncbi:hypothetical protein CEXT_85041 [Caerostris extrusa]|uniref:Uncharacterized protein n=1 Tax=Caerostris extrusa TaxID=172846 RepID=A0AAV4UE59_CAEEX|nr:hypothetical protein CEXT_85041 [Caerostris extrusa]